MNDYKGAFDRVSAKIRGIEAQLQETGHVADAEYGTLLWRKVGKDFRICVAGGTPLIDAPIGSRIYALQDLDGLVTQADRAMDKLVTMLEGKL